MFFQRSKEIDGQIEGDLVHMVRDAMMTASVLIHNCYHNSPESICDHDPEDRSQVLAMLSSYTGLSGYELVRAMQSSAETLYCFVECCTVDNLVRNSMTEQQKNLVCHALVTYEQWKRLYLRFLEFRLGEEGYATAISGKSWLSRMDWTDKLHLFNSRYPVHELTFQS